MSPRKKNPGITIWQRGKSWSYQVEIEPDPLTGDRRRPSKGGFATHAEALEAAMDAKKRHESGRAAHARRVRLRDFLDEWLDVNGSNLKETTAQNYRDNINAYINPVLGDRWLGDITVPTLNAFYKHLREAGRRKGNSNARMYAYWSARKDERDGLGPQPRDIAAACGTTLDAAREAARRYRRGRVPTDHSAGLSVKSVRNVHVVVRLALGDAVRWGYLYANPAEHAVIPRPKARTKRQDRTVWTLEQLARWLRVALTDRYDGMWLLAATTGMRRSELAGVERAMLDLDRAVLTIEDTRVVVGGKSRRSDGKTDSSVRDVSLDAFTVEHLRRFLSRIDDERDAYEGDYPDHEYVMVGPEGRPLHPDTITARFNRLVDRAGVPRIRLHDVRHTYATMALDLDQNVKTVSDRIGHSHSGITLKLYTHRSKGKDRPMADHLGRLISGAVGALDAPLATNLATDGEPETLAGQNPHHSHPGRSEEATGANDA
jgi:integrase